MPLPTTGPISLSQIQTEFGGTNPISLSEYYGAASEVPASGELTVSDFYGTSAVNEAFELTIETTSSGESVTLGLLSVTSIDVDWGDGTVDTGITSDYPNHTYSSAGEHSISVTGSVSRITFSNISTRFKIRTVTNLGSLGWTLLSSAFNGCTGMTSFVCGDTDTSSVTDMNQMFRDCTGATTIDVSGFNTSSVTNMDSMFRNCSSVTTLDVSGFNTSSVTAMGFMFNNCSSVTTLDVSGFDMSNINSLTVTFSGCSSLTSVNVSGLDTSNVITLSGTFQNCASLENLDIDGWNVTSVGGVASGTNFLVGANLALTTAQYDAVLIAWAAQSVNNDVVMHFGDATYTAGGAAEAARTTLISTYGWTITDGGAA